MDKSRYVLLAAAGIAAAIGGALFQGKQAKQDAPASVSPSATPSSNLLATLASGQLKSPNGEAFKWQPVVLNGKPQISVINFWATWCAPCVEEMPELDRLSKSLGTGRVIGVAIDNPTNVREFLQKTPVTYPIAMAGLEGTDYVRELGNTAGGLPFTVIIDKDGKVLFSKMGKTNEAELKAQLSK